MTFFSSPFFFKGLGLFWIWADGVGRLLTDCLRAGETLRGDIWAATYPGNPKVLTYFVNGKKIPIVERLGKFRQVFTTSGLKKFEVKAVVKNPLTGQSVVFNRAFQKNICE